MMTKAKQELMDKLRNMKDYEVVTISGIDYDTLMQLSDENSWAEQMLESEYGGWIVRVAKDAWQPASYSCCPPTYNETELEKLVADAGAIVTDPDEIKRLVFEYFRFDLDLDFDEQYMED